MTPETRRAPEAAPTKPRCLNSSDPASTGSFSAMFGSMRVVFGDGAVDSLGDLARERGGSSVLLVTDPGLRAAGHAGRAESSLAAAGATVALFDGVEENPTTRHVETGAAFARPHAIDLIVGLGGGSVMDVAKGINFLLTNGGKMEDYWGTNRAARPMLPSIGVPTTAGTGSESQSYALIEQEGSRRKMACGDLKARFSAVILDPGLTASLPRHVAAMAAMDAISHAIESYVCSARNPLSMMLARESFGLLTGGLSGALMPETDAQTRGRMLLGAHLAGAAIESSMLGAAHACANPLTSRFGVAHGAAVLLMLPHVVRFNQSVAGPLYTELLCAGGADPEDPGDLAERLVQMKALGGLPDRLRDAGVPHDALARLSEEASEQWTAGFNPRPVTTSDLRALYESAY